MPYVLKKRIVDLDGFGLFSYKSAPLRPEGRN